MKELIAGFPAQLHEAIEIGKAYKFKTEQPAGLQNVILTGLGGSGIGGSIVQNFVTPAMKVPFFVNKDYSLPAFIGAASLVLICSYSGNTEETVAAMHQAMEAGATVVCITSGGKIAEMAQSRGLDCILVPGGMPPRACLGYSLVQVLYVLEHFGLIQNGSIDEIAGAADKMAAEQEAIKQKAQEIAQVIARRTPIIYAAADMEGVAIRFRQQLNENGKMLCWHHVIPEMNHNELVGWRDEDDSRVVILLRNKSDYERVQMRMEINKDIVSKYTPHLVEIFSEGDNYWERAFYLIHLTDWVSVFCADIRGFDATEVKVIDFLKGELSKA